jgi:hypothetical protein
LGEGEFALGKQHLETALGSSMPWAGDHDFLATLVDNAAIQR